MIIHIGYLFTYIILIIMKNVYLKFKLAYI